MTPHKHAALIKAWADGAEIQVKQVDYFADDSRWVTTKSPTWNDDIQYRIKPKTIKYRTYFWQDKWGTMGVNSCTFQQDQVKDYEYGPNFVKWLGDWQEVVVE